MTGQDIRHITLENMNSATVDERRLGRADAIMYFEKASMATAMYSLPLRERVRGPTKSTLILSKSVAMGRGISSVLHLKVAFST
jgi:hypothetical protein